MPLYEYACAKCGHQFEARQRISEAPLTKCPACNEDALEKLVSASSFALKGGGWYADGYGSGASSASANAKSTKTSGETKLPDAKPDSTPASKSDGKSDSKPAGGTATTSTASPPPKKSD